MDTPLLEVDRVSKRFGDLRAVTELSFTVRRGEVFGFLGPNGAGKTTTLRMILDITRPDAGEVRFERRPGIDRARSGYLPEERGLFEDMPVLDTLVYLGALRGMSTRDARDAARAWLERVGLTDRAAEKVNALSKGNQQKVQFGGAVIHRPALVVLDEPFSGLDPLNQDLFLGLMRELRDAGTAVLLSAHHLDLVERLADRFLLIARGRALLAGTLEEIRRAVSGGSGAALVIGAGSARRPGPFPGVARGRARPRRAGCVLDVASRRARRGRGRGAAAGGRRAQWCARGARRAPRAAPRRVAPAAAPRPLSARGARGPGRRARAGAPMTGRSAWVPVARWELFRILRRADFVVSVLLTPLITLGAIWLGGALRGGPAKVAVVWLAPSGAALPAAASPALPARARVIWRPAPATGADREALMREIVAKRLDGAVVVPSGYAGGDSIDVLSRRASPRWGREVGSALLVRAHEARAAELGIPVADLEALDRPLALRERTAVAPRPGGTRAERVAVLALLTLMMAVQFSTISYLMIGISGEKQARVTEVVVSAVPAQAWMDGKLVAFTVVGLIMAVVWAGSAIAAAVLLRLPLPGLVRPLPLLLTLAYTTLGLYLYNALFAALMATLQGLQSTAKFQGYFFMLPFVPFFFIGPLMEDPDAGWMAVLSLVPLFSSSLIPARLASGTVPAWEVGARTGAAGARVLGDARGGGAHLPCRHAALRQGRHAARDRALGTRGMSQPR